MCLYATSQILIAEEDIPCYKQLEINYHSILPNVWKSPIRESFYGFTFMKKWTKRAKFKCKNPIKFWESINEGIHAYTVHPASLFYTKNAYIPKGTRYIIGRDYDIVAEKLVVILKE